MTTEVRESSPDAAPDLLVLAWRCGVLPIEDASDLDALRLAIESLEDILSRATARRDELVNRRDPW